MVESLCIWCGGKTSNNSRSDVDSWKDRERDLPCMQAKQKKRLAYRNFKKSPLETAAEGRHFNRICRKGLNHKT